MTPSSPPSSSSVEASYPAKKANPLVLVFAALFNGVLISAPLIYRRAVLRVVQDPVMLVFFILALGWLFFEGDAAQAARNGSEEDIYKRRPLNLLGGITLFTFWLALTERLQHTSSPFSFTALVGIPLFLTGAWLRVSAIRTLGPYFLNYILLLPEHPLITQGIYSRMRHPSETGTLLILIGSTALLGAWVAIGFGLILFLPTMLYRINKEDQLLKQRHPLAFNAYVKKVNQLIPFL